MNFKSKKVNYQDTKSEALSVLNCEWFAVKDGIPCNLCKNAKLCKAVQDRVFYGEGKIELKVNCSIRYEKDGSVEVVRYAKPFKTEVKDEILRNIKDSDRSRMLRLNDDGTYEIIKDNFTIHNLYRSINNSSKRSLQMMYNYFLANDWQYFLTLTFSPEHVDRFDDFAVKEKWSIFEKWVKRYNPDAKIIIIPERHKRVEDGKRALHFHGFLSDVPNIRFTEARDKDGKPLKSKSGKPLLNLVDWKYGFSTVAVIPPDDNFLRVVNYVSKYITKENDVGYGQKRYYHTRNLNACNHDNYFFNDKDFEEVKAEYGLEEIKSTEKITVYRGKLRE